MSFSFTHLLPLCRAKSRGRFFLALFSRAKLDGLSERGTTRSLEKKKNSLEILLKEKRIRPQWQISVWSSLLNIIIKGTGWGISATWELRRILTESWYMEQRLDRKRKPRVKSLGHQRCVSKGSALQCNRVKTKWWRVSVVSLDVGGDTCSILAFTNNHIFLTNHSIFVPRRSWQIFKSKFSGEKISTVATKQEVPEGRMNWNFS